MRMNLKNSQLKTKNKKNKRRINLKKVRFNTKNLYVFLLSYTLFSFVIGIIFYFFLNSSDKDIINTNINNYFKIKDSYNYLNLLKESFLSNTYDIFLIWILGLSVIGIIIVLFLYFCEMFSIGFTLTSIISVFKTKGVIGILIYLVPSKILSIIVLYILTFFSIKISYKIILLLFSKKEINIKKEVTKYFKVLLFSFFAMILVSILEVFIDPMLIKIFTKI